MTLFARIIPVTRCLPRSGPGWRFVSPKSAEKPRHSCRGGIGVGRAGLNAQEPNKTHAVPEPSMGEGTAEREAPAFMPGRTSPGTFTVEPHLAERWDTPNETTYLFHLRQGVKWHHKPPLNGRELVAEDVKFTFDRFLTVPGNALRSMLEPVERIEVVDRYTVKFVLKEPFVWLLDTLAQASGMWIIAPEVVQHFGDLKRPESAIGTGPFLLEHYEPNVKTVFKRNPDYFLKDQPYVDGVEWLAIEDDSTGLAMYRTGQIDCGPWYYWSVRQPDLEALKQSHPHLRYQDVLANNANVISMRVDQPPFTDVRVRRAIAHAMDRQAII